MSSTFRRATREIRKLWATGDLLVLPHARLRMIERRIDDLDLQNIILKGHVVEQQLGPRGLIRHRVLGTTVDGAPAWCVVSIEKELLIITVVRPP